MENSLFAQLMALNDTAQIRDDYVRACFGFPGGKSRSIKNLLSILPYRSTWVDAFAGSGVATLARRESKLEVFNDRHAGISCFFRVVKDKEKCKRLCDWLSATVCSREEFIICRDTWNCDWNDEVERAARWYYSIVHSFNHKGWAFGRATSGRSQCGKLLNNLELFWPIQNRLARTYIENVDYRILCQDYNNDRIGDDITWYLDPPYWKTIGIYDHEFKEEEHYEIAERCMRLNGFVALSGYDTPNHPYNKFKWDAKHSWEVQVSMTAMAFTDTNNLSTYKDDIKRGKTQECLWVRDSAR